MTTFPQRPNLKDDSEYGFKELIESHLTFVPVGFGYSLMILIKKGFKTDGASVPYEMIDDIFSSNMVLKELRNRFPKITTRFDLENLVKNLIGNPWDMPRLLAAIVHDALYGMKWKFRWLCDIIYKIILIDCGYDRNRSELEYLLIRIFGLKRWSSVSDSEIERTNGLVSLEIVRNKKISKITEEFQRKYG